MHFRGLRPRQKVHLLLAFLGVFGHTPPVRPLRPGCFSVAMHWPAIACKLRFEALPPSVVPGPSRTRAGDGHSGQEAGGGRSGGGRRDCGRPTHPSAGESFTTTPVDLCPGGVGMGMVECKCAAGLVEQNTCPRWCKRACMYGRYGCVFVSPLYTILTIRMRDPASHLSALRCCFAHRRP